LKVIIAGGRDYHEYTTLVAAVANSQFTITEVVSGGASGVDALGEKYARDFKIPLKVFRADWNTYGKAAGPMRNKEMALYADALIALWDGKSKGTKNMIDQATVRGLEVYVLQYNQQQTLDNFYE
jgi:hypothetical protein